MKSLFYIIALTGIIFTIRCSKEKDAIEDCAYGCSVFEYFSDTLTRSTDKTLKGQILFSWKNSENSWNYAVAPNLNCCPAQDYIFQGNTVTGYECLKKSLKLFAEGETISWANFEEVETGSGLTVPLSYPPEDVINELKAYCDLLNIALITY